MMDGLRDIDYRGIEGYGVRSVAEGADCRSSFWRADPLISLLL